MAMIRQPIRIAFLLLALIVAAGSATASDPRVGRVIGWVEDSQGMPVAGALVSVFAKGMRDGGFVTFSDEAGRFLLMALPPGSYTMRAVRSGHAPAPARQITVLPNQDSILSVSLAALSAVSSEEIAARAGELTWLERHKRRSVLEDRDPAALEVVSDAAPTFADVLDETSPWLSGSLEVMADSTAWGTVSESTVGTPGAGSGVLRLKGKIADGASFSLGGVVAETQTVSWRMATELSMDAGSGHELQVGAGYGAQLARLPSDAAADSAGVGTVSIGDQWRSGRLAISVGARHSYIGFVSDRNHTDPSTAVDFDAGGTHLRGSLTTHTLAPGGDLLTLSTLNVTPVITDAVTDDGLRPERIVRYELSVERRLGPAQVEGRLFHEGARDQLINAYSQGEAGRVLHVFNGRGLSSRGGGVAVSRNFGSALSGSFEYTYGHSWRDAPLSPLEEAGELGAFDQASFHDFVARVETFCGWSDTRLVAFYRLNTLHPAAPSLAAYDARQTGGGTIRNTRFDVQLSQGLPFLGSVTRADWDLLFAVRNLFYDGSDEGTLDEIAVVNPPNRVLGGISVRF